MNHSKSAKNKFNIEDCSESEQEETQRKSLNVQSQSLFQTSLFGGLDSQVKQFKKKPIVKKSMTEFLNNYDQNFDDVFGSMKMPIDVSLDHSENKKSAHNNNNNTNNNNNGQKSNKKQTKKRPIETVNSESDSNSEILTTIKKQSKPNRNGKKKQSKKIVDSDSEENKEQVEKVENKIPKKGQPKKQTKINSKQSSEEQSSENKKYNPNSVDLPQNSKKDKKGQKLKTAIFNFGTEEPERQAPSNKKNKKDTPKRQTPKTRSKKQVEQDDDSKDDKIEQLIKEYQKQEQEIQKNLTNRKDKGIKDNGTTEKVENKDKNNILNSIKKNYLTSECSPKTKSDEEDDIDDS